MNNKTLLHNPVTRYLTRLGGALLGRRNLNNGDDFWYNPIGLTTSSGENVTPDTALSVTSVWAAVNVLSNTMAAMPLNIYRRKGERNKQLAIDHPLYKILKEQPNQFQTAFEFWSLMYNHLLLRGNAYAYIVYSGNRITELIPLNPDKIEVKRIDVPDSPEDGLPLYIFNPKVGGSIPIPRFQLFHLRGFSVDGLIGLSPITMMRDAVGLAMTTERFGNKSFKNGAIPGGIITTAKKLNIEAIKRLKAGWSDEFSGSDNANKTQILQDGMEFKTMAMTSEDAQFLETRQHQVTEIARMFEIPPHMIQDLSRATFSNIEHQAIQFVTYSLLPRGRRVEQAVKMNLIGDDNLFAEYNYNSLLRGDTVSRFNAYGSGINNGWLTRNEARGFENLNPIDGLDEPLIPLNMGVVGQEPAAGGVNNNSQREGYDAIILDVVRRVARLGANEFESVPEAAFNGGFHKWREKLKRKQASTINKTIQPLLNQFGIKTDITNKIINVLDARFSSADNLKSELNYMRENWSDEVSEIIYEGLGYGKT